MTTKQGIQAAIPRMSALKYMGRDGRDNTSKNKLFSQLALAVAVVKQYVEFVIYKYRRIFDVILGLTSVF